MCKDCDEFETILLPKIPMKPSAAEIEDHRRTHYPFRNWCKECCMGRGLGEQRGAHSGREHSIPRVGVDFWYITTGGVKKRDELIHAKDDDGEAKLLEDRRAGSLVKCLIVRCHETKCLFAHIVPCRGGDQASCGSSSSRGIHRGSEELHPSAAIAATDEEKYITDLVCSDVAWLGHAKLILKSDNEKAILSLVSRALKALKCQVEGLEAATSEQSQAYDSQSNGGTEVGIRAVRGLFRTLRLCLERRIGYSIPPRHPLTAWLMEYTAHILTAVPRAPTGSLHGNELAGVLSA